MQPERDERHSVSFTDGQLALPYLSAADVAAIERERPAASSEPTQVTANGRALGAADAELVEELCRFAGLLTIGGKAHERGMDLVYIRSADALRICYRELRGTTDVRIQIFNEPGNDCIFEALGRPFCREVTYAGDLQRLYERLGNAFHAALLRD